MRRVIVYVLCCGFPVAAAGAPAADTQQALELLRGACAAADAPALATATGTVLGASDDIVLGGRTRGWRATLETAEKDRFEVQRLANNGQLRALRVEWWRNHKPLLAFSADGQCEIRTARRIVLGADGETRAIAYLDARLNDTGKQDPVNPPVPAGASGQGVSVALVDSGVNYTLRAIHTRLARDDSGAILGYDFWDLDRRPFDANPARSVFFPQRHGTRTASVLLREAPGVNLVPYRYPRPDMSRMTALLHAVEDLDLRVVGMPLGSPKPGDWEAFAAAARGLSNTLFIVSAGNNGRDIDRAPSYPAVLDLPNMVVVTSADDGGYPAPGSNWGPRSVDLLVPAERLSALDFDGASIEVSGSSYSVSRVVALLARQLEAQPELGATQLKRMLETRAVKPGYHEFVGMGYLPDPLLTAGDVKITSTEPIVLDPDHDPGADATLYLPLNIALLAGSGWREEDMPILTWTLNSVLAQCGIRLSEPTLYRLQAVDRLLDFNAAHGHTIVTLGDVPKPAVYLVRDTLRDPAFEGEAFGRANSRLHTWLRDTVWLTATVQDPAVALAHELFHVITNSGEHVDAPGNLMNRQTSPGEVNLSQAQCDRARSTGARHGLLLPPAKS